VGLASSSRSSRGAGLLIGFFMSTVLLCTDLHRDSVVHVVGTRPLRHERHEPEQPRRGAHHAREGWHNNHHYYRIRRQGFYWWSTT